MPTPSISVGGNRHDAPRLPGLDQTIRPAFASALQLYALSFHERDRTGLALPDPSPRFLGVGRHGKGKNQKESVFGYPGEKQPGRSREIVVTGSVAVSPQKARPSYQKAALGIQNEPRPLCSIEILIHSIFIHQIK